MVKITIIDTDYSKEEYYNRRVKETNYFTGRKISSRSNTELLEKIYTQSHCDWKLNTELLKRIYIRSGYNWHLILTLFQNEDYIWWSYINYEQNRKLRRFIDKLKWNIELTMVVHVILLELLKLLT